MLSRASNFLSPFGWSCRWAWNLWKKKKITWKRKKLPKTAVGPRRVITLLAFARPGSPPQSPWASSEVDGRLLGGGLTEFWAPRSRPGTGFVLGPFFFQKPSGLAGRDLGALGA